MFRPPRLRFLPLAGARGLDDEVIGGLETLDRLYEQPAAPAAPASAGITGGAGGTPAGLLAGNSGAGGSGGLNPFAAMSGAGGASAGMAMTSPLTLGGQMGGQGAPGVSPALDLQLDDLLG